MQMYNLLTSLLQKLQPYFFAPFCIEKYIYRCLKDQKLHEKYAIHAHQ